MKNKNEQIKLLEDDFIRNLENMKNIPIISNDILDKEEKVDKENDDVIHIEVEISDKDMKLIRFALRNHFLFKEKIDIIVGAIVKKLILIQLKTGSILFNEGDPGSFFYIVKEGKLEFSINKGPTLYFKSGDTFGELALIHKNKRTGTIKCLETAQLFCLDGVIFREIVTKLNRRNLKDRLFFLSLIPIFAGLDNIKMNNIALAMLKCEFDEGHTIIREGDKGDSMYIIKEGTVICMKGDLEIRKLYKKDYFGESAILFNIKRTLSIKSNDKTICFQISNEVLNENLGDDYKNIIINSIAKVSFIKSKYMKNLLHENYFNKILCAFSIKFYKNDEIVYSKEDKNKIIIILNGDLFYIDDDLNRELAATRGELFGEHFVKYSKEKLKKDIIAATDCICLEASWDEIVQKLEIEMDKKKILSFYSKLSQMKKIQIFRHCSDSTLIEICKKMKKEEFLKGNIIFEEGSEGNKLYLVIKGIANASKNNKFLRSIEEGNFFGEVSLLVNEPRTATIVAYTDLKVYTLAKEDFLYYIDKKMLEFLVKKVALQDNFSINLKELHYVKSLGTGKFGTVYLVHNKKNLYAIKAISIKTAEKNKILINYCINEKNILLKLDHPFIMKLVKTFKNDEHIFYLMEYVPGIVMSKYIENRLDFNLRQLYEVQFYSAMLLIIIDYLNSKSVCHRDIKPENIIIDDSGYIKLIDFGSSVIIKDFTSTITGTPHYIAPEILLGKGYSYSCDYWSIGILAFEIYFNYFPFGNNSMDPMDVYRDILKKQLNFPSNYGDIKVVDFLGSLLKKNVSERICNLEKAKNSDLLKDFKWNLLIEFSLNAPMIPQMSPRNDIFSSKILFLRKFASGSEFQNVESNSFTYEEEQTHYDADWINQF